MLKFIRFIFTKKFWVNIAVFLVLFVIGIWALFSHLGSRTLHGEEIKVPRLIGFHVSEIKNLLEQDGLNYAVMDSIYVEKSAGGMVVEQNPDSGMLVKNGRKIYVTLSSYTAPKIPVPNLKWDQKRNVIAQLSSMGFKIGNIRYIPSVCEDCLERIEIDSVELKSGTRLDIGTELDLVLGGGSSDQFIPVPYLIGTPLRALENTVINTGLILGSVVLDEEMSSEDSSQAMVYKQSPEPGTEDVHLGTAMTVFVSTDYNKLPKNELDSASQTEQYEQVE
ncbi:MAG: hypothetical protein CL840_22015 [Crocinitomicaceae bacterium]|nr:hypothetical protein [Crocinitomicaceae bacterium]|tara:strand:+ start:1948 stop:2781 length:834 start_codon:yes stop_codon:yes gene_type:complete